MAFSILRFTNKLISKNFLERNIVFIQLLRNVNVESSRNMSEVRHCTPFYCPLTKPGTPNSTIRDYSKQVKHQQKSDSESDSDLEVLGHRGETDFWRRKIRTFHAIVDVNKDGVISYDDFRLLSDRFVNLGHLSDREAAEFREIIKNLWEKQWGEISPYNLVTVEKYLEDMHHVLNDKQQMKRAHSFLPYLFKAVDKDRSGEISVEEFKLFFECLGLGEAEAEFAFGCIDTNKDGKISTKEFVKHGRDFFLTEDESRISKYFWGPLIEH